MIIQPFLQGGLIRDHAFHLRGGQKLHLGPQSASNDRVILIQAEPDRLPIIDVLHHIFADEGIQFRRAGRALPGLLKLSGQPRDTRRINGDRPVSGINRPAPPACDQKDQKPRHQKVDKGFTAKAFQPLPYFHSPLLAQGNRKSTGIYIDK